MGSGSSKSKERAIKICGQGLPEAPVVPTGSRTTTLTCEQKKGDNNKETFVERNNTAALTEKSRFIAAVDPDLKLIEDILAESEDYFPWPASPFARQVTSSQDTTTNQGSSLLVQQNQRVDSKNLQTITNKPVAEYEELQHQRQTARDDCRATAPVEKVLDIENNNLTKFSDTVLALAETSTPVTYDDVEEALMDSIEKEYSHIHPTLPLHCGET